MFSGKTLNGKIFFGVKKAKGTMWDDWSLFPSCAVFFKTLFEFKCKTEKEVHCVHQFLFIYFLGALYIKVLHKEEEA